MKTLVRAILAILAVASLSACDPRVPTRLPALPGPKTHQNHVTCFRYDPGPPVINATCD